MEVAIFKCFFLPCVSNDNANRMERKKKRNCAHVRCGGRWMRGGMMEWQSSKHSHQRTRDAACLLWLLCLVALILGLGCNQKGSTSRGWSAISDAMLKSRKYSDVCAHMDMHSSGMHVKICACVFVLFALAYPCACGRCSEGCILLQSGFALDAECLMHVHNEYRQHQQHCCQTPRPEVCRSVAAARARARRASFAPAATPSGTPRAAAALVGSYHLHKKDFSCYAY